MISFCSFCFATKSKELKSISPKTILELSKDMWLDFNKEINLHDGIVESDDEILFDLRRRINIQGCRSDMHFELAFLNSEVIGITMFAIDLGTVYGLLEKGYGTVMGFYITPDHRRKGFGSEFWQHIETILRQDGATNFYLCPDSITGIPFWAHLGFIDSGKVDPDDKKPIFIKVCNS